MKRRKIVTWALVVSLSFCVGFVTDVADNYFEISKNLDIFGKLYREINSLYVDDTNPSELMRTGIDAMLESLDPYTKYISEEELEDVRFMSTGQYGGIGALIGKRRDRILVLEPYEGYPADQAGLRAGDEIIRIGNTPVSGKTQEVVDIRNLLRGDKSTEVSMTVKRAGEQVIIRLTRDRIRIDNVPFVGLAGENIGYIALTGFTQNAGREVQQATRRLKEENPNLTGIILDLRGNPGGRLDEAVNVANTYIPQKELVVETRGRIDGSYRKHLANRAPVDTEIPLVVLVNKRSASASEIVAGSLQDLDRAVILGRRSFGKGLVQNIRPLSYNTQLKITTAKYYTPSGRCIQAINYAERNEDGSVGRIPDSLMRSYPTRNGRTVLDGGGIAPDVSIDLPAPPPVLRGLMNQSVIFDYATKFVKANSSIAPARSFRISETQYAEFLAYAASRKFTYDTQADKELAELETILEKEAYGDQLKPKLNQMAEQLESLKRDDLIKHQAAITQALEEEIVLRYYYRAGVIEAGLDHDPDIAAARKLLQNPMQYQALLAPPTDK